MEHIILLREIFKRAITFLTFYTKNNELFFFQKKPFIYTETLSLFFFLPRTQFFSLDEIGSYFLKFTWIKLNNAIHM